MTGKKFYTEVEIQPCHWPTGYSKKNMFIGSCFTENVGTRMENLGFNTDINPFGILYNPVSVANAIEQMLDKKVYTESDLIEAGGLWHSFDHHGRFSAVNTGEALGKINSRMQDSAEYLTSTDFLFITFGTSWIYTHIATGKTVANCHKIAAREFQKLRLNVSQIVETITKAIERIFAVNSKLKIIFTVSPVRHWSDGVIENQRSKAALILAIDELLKGDFGKRMAYFPAYEIVMDELRDYRFYREDMIHLTEVAVDYIWEKFSEYYIDRKSRDTLRQVNKILLAKRHKPIHRNTPEFRKFVENTLRQIDRIESGNPHISLALEKRYFWEVLDEICNKMK
ncbi:MAG: GSCFA domain protein [Draconibacterium sp.]|nr:MAG: GSCFA domain protein [Draconibacterium sp.]